MKSFWVTYDTGAHLCIFLMKFKMGKGHVPTAIQMEGKTIILQVNNNNIVQIYSVSYQTENQKIKTTFPLMPAYALTFPKAQGQTLNHSIVWLDSPIVAPGRAYIALSRCKTLTNIRFMTSLLSAKVSLVTLSLLMLNFNIICKMSAVIPFIIPALKCSWRIICHISRDDIHYF